MKFGAVCERAQWASIRSAPIRLIEFLLATIPLPIELTGMAATKHKGITNE